MLFRSRLVGLAFRALPRIPAQPLPGGSLHPPAGPRSSGGRRQYLPRRGGRLSDPQKGLPAQPEPAARRLAGALHGPGEAGVRSRTTLAQTGGPQVIRPRQRTPSGQLPVDGGTGLPASSPYQPAAPHADARRRPRDYRSGGQRAGGCSMTHNMTRQALEPTLCRSQNSSPLPFSSPPLCPRNPSPAVGIAPSPSTATKFPSAWSFPPAARQFRATSLMARSAYPLPADNSRKVRSASTSINTPAAWKPSSPRV